MSQLSFYQRLPMRTKLVLGMALVIVVLSLPDIASFVNIRMARQATAQIMHSNQTTKLTNQTLTDLINIDVGYRGYLLTGNDAFLDPYREGRAAFPEHLAELRTLTAGDQAQQQHWQELDQRLNDWLVVVAEPGLQLRESVNSGTASMDTVSAYVRSGEGKRRFDAMRALMADALQAQENALMERTQVEERVTERLQLLATVGEGITIVIAILLALFVANDLSGAIAKLDLSARRKVSPDSHATFEPPRGDEIGRVGEALDARLALDLQRDELQTAAAHDLRTPLAAAKLNLELLQRRYSAYKNTLAGLSEGFGGLKRDLNDLADLVDGFLDSSRISTTGAVPLDREPTDLVQLVYSCVEQVKPLLTGQRIEVRAKPQPLVGCWDRRRIRRVLMNLLGNAIKYSPEGGLITISAGEERDDDNEPTAVLCVSDQGLGIPRNELDRMFGRYERASNVKRLVSGLGIGLLSVRQIVEQHGGRVQVDSREGVGSTFTVRLPLS